MHAVYTKETQPHTHTHTNSIDREGTRDIRQMNNNMTDVCPSLDNSGRPPMLPDRFRPGLLMNDGFRVILIGAINIIRIVIKHPAHTPEM